MSNKTWRFTTSPSSGLLPFRLVDGECLLAEIKPCPSTGSSWDDEEILSLIQVAPELLAILQPFIEIWNRGGPDYEKHMIDYWSYDNLSKARAAIAKATESEAVLKP